MALKFYGNVLNPEMLFKHNTSFHFQRWTHTDHFFKNVWMETYLNRDKKLW